MKTIAYSIDTITVSWDPPNIINGDLSGYRLDVDKADTEEYFEIELGPRESQYTMKNLYIDSLYRFQIMAYNKIGDGPVSPIHLQYTEKDVMSKFLSNLKGQSIPAPEIQKITAAVSWTKTAMPIPLKPEYGTPHEHT